MARRPPRRAATVARPAPQVASLRRACGVGLTLAVLSIAPHVAGAQAARVDCATWQDCRTLALEAAGRQDYEAFHDLAWRALGKGPKNDAGLMQMLARAQSLSGRPLDALVMLERLAALGVTGDAATSDDFRRVRALPGWADFEARVAQLPAVQAPSAIVVNPASPPAPAASRSAVSPIAGSSSLIVSPPATPRPGRGRASRAVAPAVPTGAVAGASAVAPPAAPSAPLAGDAAEALRFTTLSFTPAGLAYDAVSDRFIVGDRDSRKLTVVDEASQRVANLAGAQSAGFGSLEGLEIDPREGDLWVITGGPATLHKLQLISGRVLEATTVDAALGPVRFADVAVLPRGGVLVLDALGGRLFLAPAKSRRLDLAMTLQLAGAASIAPESDAVVYVAHAGGISRIDLAARRVRVLEGPNGLDLAGIKRLRWHRGGLVGVQSAADGTCTILRLVMDPSGQRITSFVVLDRAVLMADPTAAALSADILYYLAAPATPGAAGSQAETIVRRVTIK